ncbi:MAG TPA: ABC transporter permease [Caldimonas sp.]|nr:ABC transporter permease [Caldimonas sp.]
MGRFLLARLAWTVPILLIILVVNFLVIHLAPGDPVQALVGDFPAPPGYLEQIRHDFGLDEPLWMQLFRYGENLARGNLGYSFANRQPVLGLILARAGTTLILMIPGLVAASVLGVVLALAAAPRAGSALDSGITALSLFGYSVPIFWLGQLLVILFAVRLGWLPAQGMTSLRGSATGWGHVRDVAWHLVLPAFSITIFFVAVVARVARASVVGVLSEDFITTAMAKGLSQRAILWRHVLPNAMIPVVTVIGYSFGYSLTGAILVETVFAWPGLGSLFVASIGNRDYPVLQGILLLSAVMVVAANLATDLAYALLDPRVRRGYGAAHA